MTDNLIFSKSKPGRFAYTLPTQSVQDFTDKIPSRFVREQAVALPEISENELARHMVELSVKNHHIDKGFYPLGSCTMKYNPKVNEQTARLDGFANIHPFQSPDSVQGALEMMFNLQQALSEISGFPEISLQPAAGAHGEFTGISIIRKYHEKNGNLDKRDKILVPDSAHGTNPASAAMSGFKVVAIKSLENGQVDIEDLKTHLDDSVAGMMMTNPNTVGIFEENIGIISRLIHDAGGLMYMDGANLNAIMGIVRPAEMGFDIMHFNLHKTFSTPHGGGGPGSGPVGVVAELGGFLPTPIVVKTDDRYELKCDCPDSIGRLMTFYGNFGMMVRAYTYILMLGASGIKRVSENAVLNANYVMHRLKDYFDAPYSQYKIMHEAILSSHTLKKNFDVNALDVAKRLMDFGIHPPTIYFPLIVHECLMVEPTETETKERLDDFCEAMIKIAEEARTDQDSLKTAPHSLETGRLDDAFAAKNINVCCSVFNS